MHPALVTTPVKAMGGILNDFAWFDEGGDCPVASQFDWSGLPRLKSVRFFLPDASARSACATFRPSGFLPDKLRRALEQVVLGMCLALHCI